MGVSLTINTIQRGDTVSSIENNDSNFPDLPTKIIYKIHNAAFSFTEEVNLTYTSAGDPIVKGITYFGHSVNIFKGTLEAGSKISGSSQKPTAFSSVFNGVPVTGTKTDSIDVSLLDSVSITVELTTGSPTTTANITPEWSDDGVLWIPLLDLTLTVGPSKTEDGFLLAFSPSFLRISFDLIVTGGDTFKVDASAKGVS